MVQPVSRRSLFTRSSLERHGLDVKVVERGASGSNLSTTGQKLQRGKYILGHDGARPLTPVWLIEKLIEAVLEHGAAMTAVPPTATIKYAEDDLMIRNSLARSTTWIAQTPQGFRRDILLHALELAIEQTLRRDRRQRDRRHGRLSRQDRRRRLHQHEGDGEERPCHCQ